MIASFVARASAERGWRQKEEEAKQIPPTPVADAVQAAVGARPFGEKTTGAEPPTGNEATGKEV